MGDTGTGATLEFDSFGWENKEQSRDHKVDSHAAFHSWDDDAASPSTANKRASQSHTSPVFGEVDNLIGKEMSKVGSSAKVDV